MSTPSPDSPIVTLGLNLSRSMRYLHESQGVSKIDLVWVLHGILGQVLAWDDDEKKRQVSEGEEFPPSDGRSYDPPDRDQP